MEYYTLVQHSGFGYGENPEFEQAVEMRSITKKQIEKVKRKDGLIFESYGDASDAADSENYPDDVAGLIPKVNGTFINWEIDGLRLYIPKRDSVFITLMDNSLPVANVVSLLELKNNQSFVLRLTGQPDLVIAAMKDGKVEIGFNRSKLAGDKL